MYDFSSSDKIFISPVTINGQYQKYPSQPTQISKIPLPIHFLSKLLLLTFAPSSQPVELNTQGRLRIIR